MANEIERLVDSVCKAYEATHIWVRRYDALFADYEIMRKQYEEDRNHKAFKDAQASARIEKLMETVSILENENSELKEKFSECKEKLKAARVSMGMRIFDIDWMVE
jgi:multidrug resistance efflux pump